MSARRGFTLIELLVVISIIAILMSLLMGALGHVRTLGDNLTCQSNLRQYAMAGDMYATDHNDILPHSFRWLFLSGQRAGIYDPNRIPDGHLWPYLEHQEVHMCPVFERVTEENIRYAYVQNAYVGGDGFQRARRRSEVETSAETVFYTEENTWVVPGLYTVRRNDTNVRTGEGHEALDGFATYHMSDDVNAGQANAAFIDGHVGWIEAEEQVNNGAFPYLWPRRELPEHYPYR